MIRWDQSSEWKGLIFWLYPCGFSSQASAGWRPDSRLQGEMLGGSSGGECIQQCITLLDAFKISEPSNLTVHLLTEIWSLLHFPLVCRGLGQG